MVYGLIGLKTHAKTSLVVREEGGRIRRYCHVGTGNYNSSTARLYEDVGILTASPAVGEDLTDLFNFLTGYSRQAAYRQLIVAPFALRSTMIELIEKEGSYGPDGHIVWKLNNLVDRRVIDALYAVSQAGTQVDLIIRAMCCLRPGVLGLSDNIRVRSLVGRYLEHSRIFYFSDGAGALAPSPAFVRQTAAGPAVADDGHPVPGPTPRVAPSLPLGGRYLLGSADMMERNLDRRVEALVDVTSEDVRARLREILEVVLADDELAWELSAEGSWEKVPVTKHFNAQRHFQELALSRGRRRGSSEQLAPIG